jgi:transcriptional regulator with XRE-family HTH domain
MSIWSSNLKLLRKQQGWSQMEMGQRVGVNGSRIRDYELGKCEPGIALLLKLVGTFKVSLDDFIAKPLSLLNSAELKVHPDLETAPRILVISEDAQGLENIVHVPVKACAGYLNGYQDPSFIESLPSYRLPGVRNGTYRSFEIEGDSMLPLSSGTIVVGRYVESWRDIRSNHTYVLVTRDEGVVYKRVINKVKNKGQLVLLSDNPIYEPYAVDIEDVNEAWAYYCHLSNAGAEQKSNLEQLLKAVEELKSEVATLRS